MAHKNRHLHLQRFRLIGLLVSCLGLCANTLRAQTTAEIIVASPSDLDLTQICGFGDGRKIVIYVKDATDTCIWDIPGSIGEYSVETLYGNVKGDTVVLFWADEPQSGTISVQVGKAGSVKATGSLALTFVPKAAVPKNLTLDYPICQSLPVHMSIDVDAGYETKYAPGALYLSWQHQRNGGGFAEDPQGGVPVLSDDDFKFEYTYPVKSYRDGAVQVQPFTCDASVHQTSAESAELTPFIIKKLYDEENDPSEKNIKPLKYEKPGPEAEEGADPWQEKNADDDYKTICRFYNTAWNETNRVPQPEQYRDPGMGDGYLYLQFGRYYDFNSLENPEKYPEYYYRYEWTFNDGTDGTPAEFAFADDEMDRFQGNGFGREKSRVILQVGEGGKHNNNYTVNVKVWCDSCIKKGGLEADFTYTASMTFNRLDSIQDFKDQDNLQYQVSYEVEAQGRVCSGQKTELKITYNDDESAKNFNNTNATLYYLQVPGNWEVSDDPGASSGLVYKYLIGRTSWDGRPGDSATIRVYPGNRCFRNLRDSSQNGKQFKIFVRNQPTKPTIYDPVVGAKITGQYTDGRWEQYKDLNKLDFPSQDEYISPHRVLVCNEIAGQSSAWLTANQSYGLYIHGESIRSSTGSAWVAVDLDNRGLRSKYLVDINQASIYEDSTNMTLSVFPGNHDGFQDADFRIGLYGRNECSGKDENGKELTGDTGIFYIKIIDTLAVDTIISREMAYAPWDTLCEGTKIDFASQYNQQYITWGSVEERESPAMVETDRVEYEWDFPEGWTYAPGSDKNSVVPSMTVGYGSGQVRLRFINRCSFDANPKYRGKKVVVHPFVRVNVVGDTTPCQAESVVYKFKKAEGADAYQWSFPDDWEIISQSPVEGTNVGVSNQASADGKDTISIGVRVGASDGNVYVVGQKTSAPGVYDVYGNLRADACDFRFDNYETHNRDSLGIRVKQWTSRPVVSEASPVQKGDTVCATDFYTFMVEKGVARDDSVFFKWFFPDDWARVDASKDSDRIDFATPILDGDRRFETVRVASSRYDCDATNVGDTLDIKVWFSDTIKVAGRFKDSMPTNKMQNKNVNPTPCEGDTVCYTLQQQIGEVDYSVFSLKALNLPDENVATLAEAGDEGGETGGGDDDGEGDGDGDDEPVAPDADWLYLEANGWEMLSKAPYHDTVKMVVGRVPMLLRAANVSKCDTSSFKQDTIRPICKVIAEGKIVADRPDDNLCEYEAVDFLFDTVQHATHYVFHYPWDKETDTVKVADAEADLASGRLTEDGQYKISFADTFAYNSGVVYLEAYNVCGVRPQNDTLKIASVLTPPDKPVLAQVDFVPFVYDAFHIISTDTVLDTICLREAVVLEAEPNDKTAATAAGWQFHYMWEQTQPDESITVFEKYPSAGAGLNKGDSLWMMTKEASATKINYLYLFSRHETCQRFGDTLTVALRNMDTTALPEGKDIINYLKENNTRKQGVKIDPTPCATNGGNVDYYLDLKALDITGEKYYFRWRKDSTQPYDNVYNAGDQTLAGGKFILRNAPADGDWTTLDTLKITLPADVDTLEIQAVVVNRCGKEAHMPGQKIQTSDAIGNERYFVQMVSAYICNEEKLTFKVVSLIDKGTVDSDGNPEYDTVDDVARAGLYIWESPWHGQPDTVRGAGKFTIDYDTAYKAGSVSVTPSNGCGDGHVSEALVIIPNDILQPPLRVQPVPSVDFASGYDPAGGVLIETLKDSLCLREKFEMAVTADLAPEVDALAAAAERDEISYNWSPVYGKAEALTVYQDDSSRANVNVPDFADSAYIIYVAARRSVCQRYGDSLRIELFPMDTIRFINDMVEDDQPYDRFVVFTPGAIRDTRTTPALDTISTAPCVGSAHTYAIKSDFHWSLSPDHVPTFSWNGGQTDADATTGVLKGTKGWLCDDIPQLPTVISVGRVGEASDALNLSVHAHNICGASVSKPLPVRPQALIDEAVAAQKPYVVGSLCEKDTIRVAVAPVNNATGYIWEASWLTKTDTTVAPEIAYPNFGETNGTVTVYGFNACGDGAVSETLELQPLLRIPQQPQAKWFDGLEPPVNDTVYDTLCLHGNNLLWVEAAFDDQADDEVVYEWELLSGYAKLTPLGGNADSIYVDPVSYNEEDRDLEMHVGDNLYLKVTARRASCNRLSQPLYIAINLTDVVPVSDLGQLLWYDADGNIVPSPTEPLCPGIEVRVGVENPTAAPAYRWQFPDPTWRLADDEADPTGPLVTVVVGEKPGAIRVSPITDPDNRRCPYLGDVLASATITLKEALPKPDIVSGSETPCAGEELTYTIKPNGDLSKIDRYRWEFPKGWRVLDAAGNPIDTNLREVKSETCRVLPDSTAGTIKVYTLSLCDEVNNYYSVSQPGERDVRPQDTARLAILAETTVCKDSTLWGMEIKALNEWTYATGYDLNVTYIGPDGTVIANPEAPLVFHFPNAPDSSLVDVDWFSGDSTRITFTPRHTGGCPNVLPVTYALKADTVPAIHGRIIAPERICMGAEAVFMAEVDDLEGVEVTYYWEVPEDEGWEIVSGAGSAEVVIKAGWYEGMDEEDEIEKLIRCYPRALCGTAAPFEATVLVSPPAEFRGALEASYWGGDPLTPTDRPCIGLDLAFDVTDETPHKGAAENVRYVWETPEGWDRPTVTGTDADSLKYAVFTASKAGEDTVRVRFLDLGDPKSCGLSQPIGYAVAIRDSAPAARLEDPPYPCKTHKTVEFVLKPDTEIEAVVWTWPAAYNPPMSEVSTTPGSLIKDDKLTVKELTEDGGFTEAFELSIRTTNACGSRDTLITVRPVDSIPNLPDDILHVSHYCLADNGYAYADKLTDYVGTGSGYHWLTDAFVTPLQDSLVHENDDPAGAETVAWMRFQGAAKATDTAQIRFYIQNDCNSTDTVKVRTAPYTYTISAVAEPDTVVYGRSGVSLAVVTTQFGTPADYTYVWYPQDRVIQSDPTESGASGTTFATKWLYNPHEYFRVTATERIATDGPFYLGHSACEAYDTVDIFVDSTFTMVMGALDTACMDVPFWISTHPYGGNSEHYYFDWYRLGNDDTYALIEDAGHTETLLLTPDTALIKIMVIGRDSTLIYDGETSAPLYVFSKVDTQYVEIEAFNVAARLIQPGRDTIKVPFGTKVKVVLEATAGSDSYAYLWSPEAMLDPHDSTMAAVTTRRLYDDCALTAMVRDLVTGCVDTLQVTIGMSDEIGDIPNAFSPNGDGINDIFMKGSDVIIFNRFGQELFRSTNQEGWDGTYKGKTVAPGEYLYVVTIRKNGQEYVKKGTVSVFTK